MKYIFDEIYSSNERVLSLVRDLLSVSRIEQGHIKNILETIDPVLIIKNVVQQMKIMARKKGVSLALNISDKKIPFIEIDPLRFHEVVENLIGNAVSYTRKSGTIEVTVKEVGRVLLISVEDTGMGISAADQKKLFTKFFRSERAVVTNAEGSGLGLYVVKSYVEGWGGKILVESNEGKGSKFTIRLPINKNINKRKKVK